MNNPKKGLRNIATDMVAAAKKAAKLTESTPEELARRLAGLSSGTFHQLLVLIYERGLFEPCLLRGMFSDRLAWEIRYGPGGSFGTAQMGFRPKPGAKGRDTVGISNHPQAPDEVGGQTPEC